MEKETAPVEEEIKAGLQNNECKGLSCEVKKALEVMQEGMPPYLQIFNPIDVVPKVVTELKTKGYMSTETVESVSTEDFNFLCDVLKQYGTATIDLELQTSEEVKKLGAINKPYVRARVGAYAHHINIDNLLLAEDLLYKTDLQLVLDIDTRKNEETYHTLTLSRLN